jgi:hypothetical protein
VSGALVEKYRSEDVVSGEGLAGDVSERTAILIDDMISSGGTIVRAARACRASGARAVWAVATHPVFTPDADRALADEALERVITLDAIPVDRIRSEVVREKLVRLDAAQLFADAIRALHEGGSIVALTKALTAPPPRSPQPDDSEPTAVATYHFARSRHLSASSIPSSRRCHTATFARRRALNRR